MYIRLLQNTPIEEDGLIQLGQPSVNPPRLVLEVGGDFNLAGSCACKVEVPPTSRFQVGGTSALQAWLPAKLKSPPLQAEVWGVHAGLT